MESQPRADAQPRSSPGASVPSWLRVLLAALPLTALLWVGWVDAPFEQDHMSKAAKILEVKQEAGLAGLRAEGGYRRDLFIAFYALYGWGLYSGSGSWLGCVPRGSYQAISSGKNRSCLRGFTGSCKES